MKTMVTISALLIAGCCFGGGLGMNEASFSANMTALEDLAEKTDGELKEDIEAEIERFEEAYDKLPEDKKKRTAELDSLWNEQEASIDKFEERFEKFADEAKAENIAKIQGVWKAEGMDLSISSNGQVAYEKSSGGSSKSVNAPITKFVGDEFEVGVLGITTTFEIDEWPHEDGDETKMKIDGVQLTLVQ